MVAGPNGSGKTTLIQWLLDSGIDFGEYINPDDIASELHGSYETRTAQAQIIAERRREACIEAKRSFSFETVMSHPSKIDILARAREAGFFVQLFFVGTDDPQINVERVTLRVAKVDTTSLMIKLYRGGPDRWNSSQVPSDRPTKHMFSTIVLRETQALDLVLCSAALLWIGGLSRRPDNSIRYQRGLIATFLSHSASVLELFIRLNFNAQLPPGPWLISSGVDTLPI